MEPNEHKSSRIAISTVEGTIKRLRWKRTLRVYFRSMVMETSAGVTLEKKKELAMGRMGRGRESGEFRSITHWKT